MELIYYRTNLFRSDVYAKRALYQVTGEVDTLCYDELGKPYFRNHTREISISHSGDYWVCLLSEQPCGVDIEKKKNRSLSKIAARHFAPAEQEHFRKGGEEAFFQIWTRKESYLKYLGTGIRSDLCAFNVLDASLACFQDIRLEGSYGAAVCTESPEPIQIIPYTE